MFKRGFDLVAPFYDSLATLVFGNSLKQAQQVFLSHLPPAANVLIIGGGSGWLLKEILTNYSPARIVYLEASAGMLHLSRRRVAGQAPDIPVEFRLGTEKNIRQDEIFDTVITPFILDLFPPQELQDFCRILIQHLRPGGWWLATDFVPPQGPGLSASLKKIMLKTMYGFFRLLCQVPATTLPDWENSLLNLNLIPRKSAYFYQGMIKSVLYQKLNS